MTTGSVVLCLVAVFVMAFALDGAEEDASCQTLDGETGSCTSLWACTPLFKRVLQVPRNVSHLAARALMQRHHCAPRKVCCPPAGAYSEPPPDIKSHPALALLPDDCGLVQDIDRLLGANDTSVFEFPWMALLAYDKGRGISFTCGGTVINERYILTAAHCLQDSLIGVRVGEHDTATDEDCDEQSDGELDCAPPVQDFTVEEMVRHPYHSAGHMQDDIGLIRLSQPIDLTQYNAKPICLPKTPELVSMEVKGFAEVAGWGVTEDGFASSALLKIQIPIVDNLRCGQEYNKSVQGGIGFKQVCAGGQEGVDSCNGDSGGPLKQTVVIQRVLRYVQQGVVSFGPLVCGTNGRPGVYTRVAHYMHWLLDNIRP